MAVARNGIYVTGLNQVLRGLKQVGTPTKDLGEAGYQAAEIVARQARTNEVPVRTGALERSIRPARVQRGAVVRAGGARVPYANPIHWGWFKRNIKPNPFFYRALDSRMEQVYQTYFAQIDKLIKKAESNG